MHLAIENHLFNIKERLRIITSNPTGTLFHNAYIHHNNYSFDIISPPPKQNKSSFSLGKRKPRQKKLEKDTLYAKKNFSQLTNILANWYGQQNNCLQKYGYTPLYLVCGFLVHERKKYPILYLPLKLEPSADRPYFTISHFGSDYIFNKDFLSLADSIKLSLPKIPSIQEHLNFSTFLNQIDDELSEYNETKLFKKHELQIAFRKANKSVEKAIKSQKLRPLSCINAPSSGENLLKLSEENPFITTSDHLQILPAYQKRLNQIIKRPDWGLTNHDAIKLLLIQALKDRNKTVLITDDGRGADDIFQDFQKHNIDDGVLNFFHASSRNSLLEKIKSKFSFDSVDKQEKTAKFKKQDYNFILEYERDLRNKIGDFDNSYIDLLLKLEKLESAPDFSFRFNDPESIKQDTLSSWTNNIIKYAELKSQFNSPSSFSWNDLQPTASIDAADTINIKRMLKKAKSLANTLKKESHDIAEKNGIPKPETVKQCKLLKKRITFFLDHPNLYAHQLEINWSPTPDEVKDLLSLLKRTQKYRAKTKEYFNTEIIHEPLQKLLPRLRKVSLSFTRFFNWRYKKNMKRLANYAKKETGDQDVMFWKYLSDARSYQKLRDRLKDKSETGAHYFGDFWQGANTNLDICRKQTRWLKTFTDYCSKHSIEITPQLKNILSGNKKVDSDRLKKLAGQIELFCNTVSVIKEFLPFSVDSIFNRIEDVNLDELSDEMQQKSDEISQIKEWTALKKLQQKADFSDLKSFIDEFHERQDISAEQLPETLTKCFYKSLLEEIKAKFEHPNKDSFEKKVDDFSEILQKNKIEISSEINNQLINDKLNFINDNVNSELLANFQRELIKENFQQPFSEIIEQFREAISVFAPVWIIHSSQVKYFKPHFADFDTIIVDEIENYGKDFWNSINSEQQIIGLSNSPQKSVNWPESKIYPLFYIYSNPKDDPRKHLRSQSLAINKIKINEQDSDNSVVPEKVLQKAITKRSEQNNDISFWFSSKKQKNNFWLKYAQLFSQENKSLGMSNHEVYRKPQTLLLSESIHNNGQAERSFVLNGNSHTEEKTGFGFKKKKSNNSSHLSLLATTQTEINIFETPENRSKNEQFQKKLHQSIHSPKNDRSSFQKYLSNNISNNWKVINHPSNPFEALLQHKSKGALTVYIYSNASSYFQDQPLLLHYNLMKHNYSHIVFFPVSSYPDKLEDWLKETQKKIKEVEKELFKGMHGLKKTKKGSGKTEKVTKKPKLILPDWMPTYQVQDEVNFQSTSSKKSSVIPELHKLPELDQYEYHNQIIKGQEGDFKSYNNSGIQSLILKLVKQESPIHWKNMVRRILSYWHVFDADISHKKRIFDNLESLYEDEKVFLKDECIYKDDTYQFALRNRSNNPGLHHADEIPPDECETAIFEILKVFSPVKKDLLLNKAAQYMGFPHLTPPLEKQYERALFRMADEEYLAQSSEGIELSDKLADIDKSS